VAVVGEFHVETHFVVVPECYQRYHSVSGAQEGSGAGGRPAFDSVGLFY